jgi:inorganic pyrophosphatase/exopolyphosphatase
MKITEVKNIEKFKKTLRASFEDLKDNQIVERILRRDFTVWKTGTKKYPTV